MQNVRTVQHVVEKALAFAHAALEDTTPHRVAMAKRYAEQALPYVARVKPRAAALGEARRLFTLVGELRALLTVVDRKLELRLPRETN